MVKNITINNKLYDDIDPRMGIASVTKMGGVGVSETPDNLIPDKVFKKPYTQLSNTFPVSCLKDWFHTSDNVPSASSDTEMNGLNLLSTGLPICVNEKKHCYPAQIGLMGEDMFENRGFSKCSDNNQVKYHKPKRIINEIHEAKKICNKDTACQGFVMSNDPKEGALFITDGLNEKSIGYMWGNMKDSRIGNNGMYTTYMKNTEPQGYVNLLIDMLNQVRVPVKKHRETEHFIGDDRIQSVVRNSALLILVLVLSTVVVHRMA